MLRAKFGLCRPSGSGENKNVKNLRQRRLSISKAHLSLRLRRVKNPREDPVKKGPEYLACRRRPLRMDVFRVRSRKPKFCVRADKHNKDPPMPKDCEHRT